MRLVFWDEALASVLGVTLGSKAGVIDFEKFRSEDDGWRRERMDA